MSNLARLKRGFRARVYTIEVLLRRMTAPVQTLTQKLEYTDTIKRINELKFEANTNLLDIEAKHGNDIRACSLPGQH